MAEEGLSLKLKMRRRLCTIETPSGRTESRYIATARCESSNGQEGRHDSLVDDPKVVFFYRADCELCKRRISYTYNRVKVKGARTIEAGQGDPGRGPDNVRIRAAQRATAQLTSAAFRDFGFL